MLLENIAMQKLWVRSKMYLLKLCRPTCLCAFLILFASRRSISNCLATKASLCLSFELGSVHERLRTLGLDRQYSATRGGSTFWLMVMTRPLALTFLINQQREWHLQKQIQLMLQGTRMDYVVPGYTGFISSVVKCQEVPPLKEKPRYQIPGYSGYVKSVKPENIHADTFGKVTYQISNDDYVRGQDIPPEHRYVSTNTNAFINPSSMLQRTAADVVGVPNARTTVRQPIFERSKAETDQFTTTRNWKVEPRTSMSAFKERIIEKEGKPYVKLGEPLPGYTGFNRRVFAGNIFGQTYANSRSSARRDLGCIEDVMKKTFTSQMMGNPNIKP